MYRGEGDESEPASLAASLVISLSKTSLIFNGAQLQRKEAKEGREGRMRGKQRSPVTGGVQTLHTKASQLATADRERALCHSEGKELLSEGMDV